MQRNQHPQRPKSLTDIEVMKLIAAGHKEIFPLLVRKYQNPLLNFFARLGVYTDREDLVQETFVRIYRYRDRYQAHAKFTTFLYTVARNVWRDSLRKKLRYGEFLSDYGAEKKPGTLSLNNRSIDKMDMQAALDALPIKLKPVVVMSIYQGLKYKEIAQILDIPVGTVKSRMHLAMAQLKEWMHVNREA